MDDADLRRRARGLAAALEPVAGQVYFAPECHEEYARLGFDPSARTTKGVAMPDGVAYFTSRGSILGQVPGDVVAATFAVFNPATVVPAVALGWTRTDATTIGAARTRGATAHLTRVLGHDPAGLDRANELLDRATQDLRPEGKPLFAGLRALGLPGDPMGDMWRRADMLREFRGDAHIAAWTSAGLDAVEVGLLTELYWKLPMGSYIRSRAWSPEELDAGRARLAERGLIAGDGFTDAGRALREEVELATDRQCRPAIEALGDDLDELVALLSGWGEAIRAAGGYPAAGPHDMAGA